ncbi:biofilm development protein AriR [Pantoea dispersa]|uniref:Biofilm development protein AriR n=1 Tax=Pantoea dispersa TaxID=59814 RepID=A0ABY3A4I9_9GAMM|nr:MULTISPECIES: biofilm/acid-resistance regulator YmgB/AriR [Pantoea]MBK4768934.1 biofilm development protein AriR [Pantoea sp. Morm]KAA6103826.1 biofilm development protein AriR [Pantoea sp. B_9]KAA6116035.1 biofilm development protein AriR [Pantoea sp. B_10]KAA8672217.1 biofilm development protein AriR [Pantoea dispersa]KTR97343.1 biofilm development protein AriR [Pantoea dispersa]
MQNAVNSSDVLADNFKQAVNSETNEMEVLGHLIAEILHSGMPVTNKAIIAALIGRLEQEADVVQLDVYRHLLELVVHQTPDDFSL